MVPHGLVIIPDQRDREIVNRVIYEEPVRAKRGPNRGAVPGDHAARWSRPEPKASSWAATEIALLVRPEDAGAAV